MFPLRRISGFFLRGLVYYGILAVPWPGVTDAYQACFSAAGNVLFRSYAGRGYVSFRPIAAEPYGKDMKVTMIREVPPRRRGTTEIKSLNAGYRPTAFLIALVLATPVAWRRRVWALLWGLLLVNAFVAFRVGLLLFDKFSDPGPLAIFALGARAKGVVVGLVRVFYQAPEMHYVIPALIWLLVTFRRGDLRRVLGRSKAQTASV